MERLTVRVKEGNRKDECFIPGNKNAIEKVEYICEGERWESEEYKGKAVDKLAEYEDLEEQKKLLKLPCAVGDTVYVIPSKTNYKLNILNGLKENNRVYEQIVNRIEIFGNGYLLSTCDGMRSVVDKFYKNTWFLTGEEAEAALKELERGKGE